MYDDGVAPDAIKNDVFKTLLFKAQQQENQFNIGFNRQYQTMPKSRALTLLLHNWPKTAKVISINHKTIDLVDEKQTFSNASQAGFWDKESRVLQVKFNWSEDAELEIK
jgi:oligosaccharide 4-alpha-D-glucosyltransferase